MSRQHDENDWKVVVEEYFNKYETLDISAKTIYKGYHIGRWIYTQKDAYKKGYLSGKKEKWLNSMNLFFDKDNAKSKFDIRWDEHYNSLKKYYKQYGSADIPLRFIDNDFTLGKWLQKQRKLARDGKLSKDKMDKLSQLEITFEKKDSSTYNSTSFPEQVMFFYFNKMFPDALSRYQGLGFELDSYSKKYKVAVEYDGARYHMNEKNDTKKNIYCNKHNIYLYRVRECGLNKLKGCPCFFYDYNKCTRLNEYETCLQSLFDKISLDLHKRKIKINIKNDMVDIIANILTNVPYEWRRKFDLYLECVQIENTPNIPVNYIYKGVKIGKWISTQRMAYNGKRGIINNTQKNLLESVGFCWDISSINWDKRYNEFKQFYKKHKRLPKKNRHYNKETSLYYWLERQQKKANHLYIKARLTEQQYDLLNKYNIFCA